MTLIKKKNSKMVFPWGHTRRFNSYSRYIKRVFGGRVQKLTLDAGFTCPNRDGTVGTGGCTYCNNDSFNPSYCNPQKPIIKQLNEGIEFHTVRYRRADKFLAYFQAYSNTYADLDYLKSIYNQALEHPKVIGIVVGTRPDCVDEAKLDYFGELAKKFYVSVEYGVESCSNQTLLNINRGHDFEKSVWAIEQTSKRGINVGAHFILGLPGENSEYLIDQVKTINKLKINTIKFHQLQIVRNTRMEIDYQNNPNTFKFYDVDGYLDLMVKIIERLNPKFVVERITGEASPRTLIAPKWEKLRTDQLLNKFEGLMAERDTWQGKFFED